MSTTSKLGPHTQTDRGTCPGVGLRVLLQKTLHYKGAQAIVRGGARFVRRRYFIVAPRPFPAAPRMHLVVVYRPLPAAPLVMRYMYMAVAVASQCCRRRLQQLICACGCAKNDACCRSFAVLWTQVSTVGLRLVEIKTIPPSIIPKQR
jgi:hypothetical protein